MYHHLTYNFVTGSSNVQKIIECSLIVLQFLTKFIKAAINKWKVNIMYGHTDHLAT